MKLLFIAIIGINLISCSEVEEQQKEVQLSKNPMGIGSVAKLELNTISDSLMKIGQQLFNDDCSSCHTMEYKNSGPDISDILAIRKPEWIVNFLTNKDEMLLRDSLAIKTRKLYTKDCDAVLNKKQALEILEYLRIYQIWLHEFNAL